MLKISTCCGGNITYQEGDSFCQICHKECEYEEQEDEDTKPYYPKVKSKEIKLRAVDNLNDTTCSEGRWNIKYIREITFNNGGIEVDAPALV